MSDLFLFQKIAVTRLKQRRVEDGSPGVRLRMPDGKGDVRLATHEWEALGGRFRDRITPSAKRLRLGVYLTLPLIIAFFGIVANAPPPFKSAVEWVFDLSPAFSLLFLCGALPLTMAALHALAVQRAIDGVNETLSSRPRLGTSGLPPPGALNALEIAALVLVGPHLVFGIVGSLNPNAFRNTPWTNARLDAAGVAGLLVLLALGFLRWRRWRQAAFHPAAGARTVDVLARARERAPQDV